MNYIVPHKNRNTSSSTVHFRGGTIGFLEGTRGFLLPGAVGGEFVVADGGHCCCRLEGRGAPGLGAEKWGKKEGML